MAIIISGGESHKQYHYNQRRTHGISVHQNQIPCVREIRSDPIKDARRVSESLVFTRNSDYEQKRRSLNKKDAKFLLIFTPSMNADQHHKHNRAYCKVGQHLREVHNPEEDIFHRFRPAIGRKFPGVIGVKEPQGLVHDLLKAFDEKHLTELPTGNGDSVLLKRTDSCVDDGKDDKEDDAEQNCFHVPVRNVDVNDPAHDNRRKQRDQTDGQIKDERERDVQRKMRYAVADKFIRCFIVVHDSFLSL